MLRALFPSKVTTCLDPCMHEISRGSCASWGSFFLSTPPPPHIIPAPAYDAPARQHAPPQRFEDSTPRFYANSACLNCPPPAFSKLFQAHTSPFRTQSKCSGSTKRKNLTFACGMNDGGLGAHVPPSISKQCLNYKHTARGQSLPYQSKRKVAHIIPEASLSAMRCFEAFPGPPDRAQDRCDVTLEA
ncbi:hypothetical protein NMY22_g10460 [Coprinellus aureogranulatus]|nr:hypothetical protein NMY22_g10460 [Coprinellus aureogranulatus]